jgi:hypothetical protein
MICQRFFIACVCAFGTWMAAAPSHASPGCVGDLDNNHVTDIADLLMVINGWGSCSGCAGDSNSDGVVNILDLLNVINSWGMCACQPQFGCVQGVRVWCEDFETGNFSRWTGGYSSWSSCATTASSSTQYVSATRSQRSQVSCAAADSHRGYGGLRFAGDSVLPSFSSASTGGINSVNGVVVTFWDWLNTPHTFSPTQWLSLMTITDDCSNNWSNVLTLNIDDSTRRIKPVHVSSVSYEPNAPAMPLQQWVRITVYVNYYAGVMHVWQNGIKIASATFTRPTQTMCQWHFGLYASGNNSNILLYEDNLSITRLTQPLVNTTIEPWFAASTNTCP